MPNLYNDTREQVCLELHKPFKDGRASLSFTYDIWTSKTNESYISLTCHFLGPLFKLTLYSLNTSHFPRKHTATRIASFLEGIIAEGDGADNDFLIYVITDNLHNISAATHALS